MLDMLLNSGGDDTPDFYSLVDWVRSEAGVLALGYQPPAIAAHREPLDQKFSVETGYDDMARPGLNGSINNQECPLPNSRLFHRAASSAHTEGGRRVLDQLAIEIDGTIDVVSGWTGKTSADTMAGDRECDTKQMRTKHDLHFRKKPEESKGGTWSAAMVY